MPSTFWEELFNKSLNHSLEVYLKNYKSMSVMFILFKFYDTPEKDRSQVWKKALKSIEVWVDDPVVERAIRRMTAEFGYDMNVRMSFWNKVYERQGENHSSAMSWIADAPQEEFDMVKLEMKLND